MLKITKMNKIFSIPLNPMLSEDDFINKFIPFLTKHKDWIYDIYFTCRIPPFDQDAMGATFSDEFTDPIIDNAMQIQEILGIKVSATFNNVNVSPKFDNYKLFIENLKPLYERGLRSITLAHAHWVAMGIKKHFPDMEIKNTILRKVATAQDFWYSAEQGFDYINVDRILMRDIEELKNIRRAQLHFQQKHGRYVKIALLTNEGCLGRCPMMDEHYSYNNLKTKNDLPYFRHEISKVTCEYKWEKEINAFFFKAATIPPFKEEFDDYLNHVDVFKMHGRDSFNRLNETMEIVESYVKGNALLSGTSELYLDGVPADELNGWRNKIKKCKFQCWDCNYCDIVAEHKKPKV
jgi:hypothetical protein